MPFTFVHPLAVVPLHRALRRHTVLSALIIGSMAPDFQNFLPVDISRAESHSLPGLFWFSLPVGMVLYLVFHLLLARPLHALLPLAAAARLPVARLSLPPASGFAIVVSLLLGALTHLAWDAFTHTGMVTGRLLPFLSTPMLTVAGYIVTPYKLLQHASSFGGTLVLWHWCRCWLRQASPSVNLPAPLLARRERRLIAGMLLALPPLAGIALALHTLHISTGWMQPGDAVREAVVNAISCFGLLLLAYAAVWHAFLWQRQPPREHGK